MNENNIDGIIKVGNGATQGASAGTIFFALTLNDLGVIIGILTAIIGLAVQVYFGREKLKIQRLAYAKLGLQADGVTDSNKAPL